MYCKYQIYNDIFTIKYGKARVTKFHVEMPYFNECMTVNGSCVYNLDINDYMQYERFGEQNKRIFTTAYLFLRLWPSCVILGFIPTFVNGTGMITRMYIQTISAKQSLWIW